jgi:hypothetical protein
MPGHLSVYNPPFSSLHPMVPPTTPALPMQPLKYPLIVEWPTYCDGHLQCAGEDFTSIMPKFDKEGLWCLHQLISDNITVEKLSDWLGIGKGMADLIIRYAEEDIAAIHAGGFQMLSGGHAQNTMQLPK